MALRFFHRTGGTPRRVALFPGAWNPPTVAHASIASSALGWADEVVWVLPSVLPHKDFDGASFVDRRRMIESVAAREAGFSAAVSDGGLYVDIAGEARAFFGAETEIALVCGRDAAERITRWDYGDAGVFARMLQEYPLLVAARAGAYDPPENCRSRVVRLELEPRDDVSSTEVRRRIGAGESWRHLVPAAIADTVAEIYALDS